jgi:hypothetical protein
MFQPGDRVVILQNGKEKLEPFMRRYIYEGEIATVLPDYPYIEKHYGDKYTKILLHRNLNSLRVLTKDLALLLPFVKEETIDIIYYPEEE